MFLYTGIDGFLGSGDGFLVFCGSGWLLGRGFGRTQQAGVERLLGGHVLWEEEDQYLRDDGVAKGEMSSQ